MSLDGTEVMEFAHHIPVNVRSLPRRGKELHLKSNAYQRARLAQNHGLEGVDCFECFLQIQPRSQGHVHVQGTLSAKVVQNCVVSGEPMFQDVHDSFVLLFIPQTQDQQERGEIIFDEKGQEEDDIEFFDGVQIDLGAVVEEFFELALDPYPRKQGVQFHPVWIGEEMQPDKPVSPFAILKKIKPS